MSSETWPQIRPLAGRFSLLFIAFILPLSFSIKLEDGFELTQALLSLLALSFLFLSVSRESLASSFFKNKMVYFLGAAFLASGFYSYLRLRDEVFFYFPSQSYLWVLTPFFLLVPLNGLLDKRKFYVFLLAAGVVGSFYSFAQFFGVDFSGWALKFGGRSFSTLGNPVFWAGHLLILLPLAVYLALSSRKLPGKIMGFGTVLILVLSLLCAQSRGAWLGILGEMAVLGWMGRRAGLWRPFGIAVTAFLLALLMAPSLRDRALSAFQIQGGDVQGRTFMWKAALKQWEEKKWLGQGPGGYAGHFHRAQSDLAQAEPLRPFWTAVHAHNDYLEILAERGIVGFGLGAWLVWILARRRVRARPPRAGPEELTMATAELAVLVGVGIQSVFNFPLSVVPSACVLAMLYNPTWETRPESPGRPRGLFTEPRVFVGAGLLWVCALGLGVGIQNARLHEAIDRIGLRQYEAALDLLETEPAPGFFRYRDSRLLKQKAAALDGLGNWKEAVEALEEGFQAYPFDADIPAALCMLYGKQKKWEEAQKQGWKALELAPSHEQALNNLAMASYLRGQTSEAVGYLSRLSRSLRFSGRKGEAAEIDRKISELGGLKP